MKIKIKIENLIRESLRSLQLEEVDFVVEHPADFKMGDYSTNIAMILAKKQGESPKDIAEKILAEMSEDTFYDLGGDIEKVVFASAGFINFFLTKEFFQKSIDQIVESKNGDKNFGENDIFAGKKVMVEYTDPNPFKPFHIGHLMNNTIGESISRIIEFSGAETIRANYQGDVGLHVAKAIWGLQKNPDLQESDDSTVELKALKIGKAYSLGAEAYEDDSKLETKKEINEINKKVYHKNDEKINEIYNWGKKVTLEAFEKIYEMLGTKFDHYFFESEMVPIGISAIKENTPEVFEESDGAIVFKGEKYDPKLHTRVFINSEGLPTYEAKDIGLTITKFKKINPDISITITATEQADYMRVVQKAISLIHPDYELRMKHVTHGMLRFVEGKMSSRKGNIVTGESLLNDVRNLVYEKMIDRNFSEEEKESIARDVGVAALKYSILKQSSGSDIIYDFEKSISFEGDSGPYLQYSYTRANSILEKAETENMSSGFKTLPSEIVEIEKLLYRFPEVVLRSAKELEPHYIANYLIEIARAFNSFYGNNKILDKGDKHSPYRVAICEAFSVVMKNGLYLLGVKAPERM